jgi:hypothetical protein
VEADEGGVDRNRVAPTPSRVCGPLDKIEAGEGREVLYSDDEASELCLYGSEGVCAHGGLLSAGEGRGEGSHVVAYVVVVRLFG